jgi:uncharacterized protein (TIGR02246 family)
MDDEPTSRLRAWVDGYVRAWNSNDPAGIGALFAEDAVYHTEPFGPPWQGREEIVRQWLERRDEPGETEFRWQPLAVTPEVALVQGETAYRSPPHTSATCGSSASTTRAAAPGSPSGGCATPTPAAPAGDGPLAAPQARAGTAAWARARSRPYSMPSARASQEAVTMSSETPTVVHSPAGSAEVTSTRVTALVPARPSRMRTL